MPSESGHCSAILHCLEIIMQALIDKHLAAPSEKTLARLLAHAKKHPFSVLLVDDAGAALLRTLGI